MRKVADLARPAGIRLDNNSRWAKSAGETALNLCLAVGGFAVFEWPRVSHPGATFRRLASTYIKTAAMVTMPNMAVAKQK